MGGKWESVVVLQGSSKQSRTEWTKCFGLNFRCSTKAELKAAPPGTWDGLSPRCSPDLFHSQRVASFSPSLMFIDNNLRTVFLKGSLDINEDSGRSQTSGLTEHGVLAMEGSVAFLGEAGRTCRRALSPQPRRWRLELQGRPRVSAEQAASAGTPGAFSC
ncbi:hypothetical protein CB1_000672012 [Camelus ferus]|nr:hypothetical protein CB1_000672012 [Camelus ferus]